MASSPDPNDRKPHNAHLFALRAGPYFLAAVGLFLVLIGTLGGSAEAQAIAETVLGGILCVTAALVTRAGDLKVSQAGVEASLTSVLDLDHGRWAVVVSGDEGAPKLPGETAENSRTSVEWVLARAAMAGWITGQTTPGVSYLTLTKPSMPTPGPSWSEGDTVTVLVPTHDPHAPVPEHVWKTLRAAGFPSPNPGDSD